MTESDASLAALYQPRIRALAARVRFDRRLAAPDVTVTCRSPTCGSLLTLDLDIREGALCDIGWNARACTLGMAALGIVSKAGTGQTQEQIAQARRKLSELLQGKIIDFPPPSVGIVAFCGGAGISFAIWLDRSSFQGNRARFLRSRVSRAPSFFKAAIPLGPTRIRATGRPVHGGRVNRKAADFEHQLGNAPQVWGSKSGLFAPWPWSCQSGPHHAQRIASANTRAMFPPRPSRVRPPIPCACNVSRLQRVAQVTSLGMLIAVRCPRCKTKGHYRAADLEQVLGPDRRFEVNRCGCAEGSSPFLEPPMAGDHHGARTPRHKSPQLPPKRIRPGPPWPTVAGRSAAIVADYCAAGAAARRARRARMAPTSVTGVAANSLRV